MEPTARGVLPRDGKDSSESEELSLNSSQPALASSNKRRRGVMRETLILCRVSKMGIGLEG